MLVLHGTWFEGRFHIWGEHYRPLEARRGRRARPRPDRALKHPYAADHEVLYRGLHNVLPGLKVEAPARTELCILLPSNDRDPAPSRELGQSPTGDVVPDRLGLWQVPSLAIDPPAAMVLLYRIPVNVIGPRPGLILGTDLRYWAQVAAFTLSILAGQHFIPDLVETDHEARACWSPLLNAPEIVERIALFARHMPPVCRAARPRAGAWEEPSALTLLTDVLRVCVDAGARAWAQVTPPTERLGNVIADWLEALVSPYPLMPSVSHSDLFYLRRILRQWHQNAQTLIGGRVRFCLRVEPPVLPEEEGIVAPPEDAPWRLQYFLQSRDDPSLLIPAKQAWRSRHLRILDHYVPAPQEALLRGLGIAARFFPPIERSLQEAQPTGCTLSTSEVYIFLKEVAPLLEQSGIGVLLPAWWAKRKVRLTAHVTLRSSVTDEHAPAGLGLSTLVDFDWQFALGDQELSPEEFEALVQMKKPLVRVRGQWVEISPEEIERALAFWQKQRKKALPFVEALRIGLDPGAVPLDGVEVTAVRVEGPLRDLLEGLEQARMELLPQPRGFRGQLRPYQIYGFSWMAFLRRWGLGACLADDMGLGKTPQTIALFLYEREQGITDRPALVVCPTSVLINWKREIERFAPSLRAMIHHGPNRLQGDAFVQEAWRHDVVITSYALLHRDIETLERVPWSDVVLDEAQNIKNPHTKTAQAARRLRADFRAALTGTPIENRLSELWSIFAFLNPGFLGSQRRFRAAFVMPIERFGSETHTRRLRRLVGPFILRRVKTDQNIIKDLPEKLEIKVYVPLTQEQVTLYQAVVDEAMQAIENSQGMERRGLVLSTLTRLKQICNHPAQFLGESAEIARLEGRSGKLERLREMLEEIVAAGDKALIFTQFRQMGGLLQRYLEEVLGIDVLFLHGGVRQKDRQQLIDAFQSPYGPPVFLLSLRAGGTGLNLTAATHVIHFDRWWNPAVENQATDRAYRIGQKRTVEVHKFISVGTVEERIDELLERKKDLAERIIGTGEDWITELSTEELRQLFALRAETVV